MNTIEKIEQNHSSVQKMYFSKSPDHYCKDLQACMDAFERNKTITTIRFDAAFLKVLTENEQKMLLKQVGSLESLKKVQLCNESVNVGSVALLLEHASSLEGLELEHENLVGSAEDFNGFEKQLKEHKALKSFSLRKFRACSGEGKLSQIVKALCNIPSLQILRLEAMPGTDVEFPRQAFMSVGDSSSLQELYFSHFNLTMMDLTYINWVTVSHPSIQRLSVPNCDLDDDCVFQIAECLERTKLQRLNLSGNKRVTDDGAELLAAYLESTTTLKFLNMMDCKGVSIQGSKVIADAIKLNPTTERWIPPFLSMERYTGPKMMRLSDCGRAA